MQSAYPSTQPQLISTAAEKDGALLIDIIRNVRNIRASLNVPAKTQNKLIVETTDNALKTIVNENKEAIQKLARVSEITINTGAPEQSATAAIGQTQLFVPLEGLIDLDAERARLTTQREKLEKEVSALNGKLSNENFTSKAPDHVVADIREKAQKAESELKTVSDQITALT